MSSALRVKMIEKRADIYDSFASDDSWKDDHEWAMLCFDYEGLAEEGTGLYESLCSLDTDWREAVFSNRMVYDHVFEKRISGVFTKWLQTSEEILKLYDGVLMREYLDRNFDVKPIKQLKVYCREARQSLMSDQEFFGRAETFELSDKALQEHRSGQTESMDCVGPMDD